MIVGGRLRVSGTGARLGKSDYLVAEADEFDRSFLRLQPIIALITNIDREHLDTYRDLDDIRDAFVTFAQKVPFFGQVILCLDDPMIQGILPRLTDRRLVTYGLTPQADLQAQDLELDATGATFQVQLGEGGRARARAAADARHPQRAATRWARSRSVSGSGCRSPRWRGRSPTSAACTAASSGSDAGAAPP